MVSEVHFLGEESENERASWRGNENCVFSAYCQSFYKANKKFTEEVIRLLGNTKNKKQFVSIVIFFKYLFHL